MPWMLFSTRAARPARWRSPRRARRSAGGQAAHSPSMPAGAAATVGRGRELSAEAALVPDRLVGDPGAAVQAVALARLVAHEDRRLARGARDVAVAEVGVDLVRAAAAVDEVRAVARVDEVLAGAAGDVVDLAGRLAAGLVVAPEHVTDAAGDEGVVA